MRSTRPLFCRWLHPDPVRVIQGDRWCWSCPTCGSTWAMLGGAEGTWRPEDQRPVQRWVKDEAAIAAREAKMASQRTPLRRVR